MARTGFPNSSNQAIQSRSREPRAARSTPAYRPGCVPGVKAAARAALADWRRAAIVVFEADREWGGASGRRGDGGSEGGKCGKQRFRDGGGGKDIAIVGFVLFDRRRVSRRPGREGARSSPDGRGGGGAAGEVVGSAQRSAVVSLGRGPPQGPRLRGARVRASKGACALPTSSLCERQR